LGSIRSIRAFELAEGRILADKYEVRALLGTGWEGEVYLIREMLTGIERAAKLFFPQRNPRNSTAKRYATKLHRLRHCGILIQYLTQDVVQIGEQRITLLISEFVEGDVLGQMLRRQIAHRLPPCEALHLLHALAAGMADIHQAREYHGDLHADNIFVRRYGIGYQVKVIDLFHRSAPKRENIQDDVCDLIRLFYDALGGAKRYARHDPEIKAICCGLKRSLILKKYRTAGQLRDYLENIKWER
jgi:tRNA A-37 threonylcarbamoyl transferase component Bud32